MTTEELFERKNITLRWIKAHAKYYLLELEKKKSVAILFEGEGINCDQKGYTFYRDYNKYLGFHWAFEPRLVNVEFCMRKYGVSKYDITKDFDLAKRIAYQHGKELIYSEKSQV